MQAKEKKKNVGAGLRNSPYEDNIRQAEHCLVYKSAISVSEFHVYTSF